MSTSLSKPVGLMILPGVSLFPGALLPLYIFEPRYRRMLAKALEQERMFAIAHSGERAAVAPVAGLGIVRACVANADGTSNLILQGIGRVAISELKMSPFPQASLTLLADRGQNDEVAHRLRSEVESLFKQIRISGAEIPQGFDGYLAQLGTPGAFADAVASVFVLDPEERRHFLEEVSVPARLTRLLRCLMQQLAEP